jgi:hypothetical protein
MISFSNITTNRKVVGSRPDEGFFFSIYLILPAALALGFTVLALRLEPGVLYICSLCLPVGTFRGPRVAIMLDHPADNSNILPGGGGG